MDIWNPWHGCHKISAGCANCYVYRRDGSFEKDSSVVTKNRDFDLPLRLSRDKTYKLKAPQTVYTCLTSDFFLEEADGWRGDCWDMMRRRADLDFVIITKRIHRFADCLPENWGDGWDNVTICSTAEDQETADLRLPVLLSSPIKHREIICEPLLSKINLSPYLSDKIEYVTVGGESGEGARVCKYEWVLDIRRQCELAGVPFHFKQTGAKFEKDGRLYNIPRNLQMIQAKKAGLDTFTK